MRVLNVLVSVAVAGALMSLGSLLSRHHMILDIGSHFRLQFIVLLLPALLVALVGKRLIAALVLFCVLLVHGYTVGFSLRPFAVEPADNFVDLDIFSSNILLTNTSYEDYKALVSRLRPDVLAIQEYTPQWHKALSQELDEYPHRVTHPLHGGFGIALYSKHPITAGGVRQFGSGSKPSLDVELALNNRPLRLLNVHPPPPTSQSLYDERNELMVELAATIKPYQGSVVVVGDFNATPWTGHFVDMQNYSGLHSARRGNGIVASWPSGAFPLLVPIDHILVSDSIDVRSLRSERVAGSDHHGIAGDLRIYFP